MIWFDSLVDLVETVNFKLELFDSDGGIENPKPARGKKRRNSCARGKKIKKFVCAGKKKENIRARGKKTQNICARGEISFVRFEKFGCCD